VKTNWIKPPYRMSSTERIVYERRLMRMQRLVNGQWLTVLTQSYRNGRPPFANRETNHET
jgi:hypothetical protein